MSNIFSFPPFFEKFVRKLKELKFKIPVRFLRKALPYIFILPFFGYIILTWIAPVIITIILSFTKTQWTITRMEFSGLENYFRIFTRDIFVFSALRVTVLYVSSVLMINAFFSLLLAILVTYFVRNESVAAAIRLAWLIPRITPAVIYALLWRWFIDPRIGLLNKMLSMFNLPAPHDWLLTAPYSQILMIVVNGYVGASFGMIIYSAAITSIPRELFYAASIDGASDLQVIRHIIVPLLKWPIFFVTVWQTLSLISSYEHILALWAGGAGVARAAGVEVWALYAYSRAFYSAEYGYGAALSVFLVIIGLVFIVIFFKIFGFERMMQPSKVEV
ncbi:MAG: sugar ABC transporter permease [Thermoproteales archaeon]|nr:sugar ABC transporter permease [Thermoproteales archaeon]